MSTAADRELAEVQLASLLNIDIVDARRALEFCGYCFEVAVDVAFGLIEQSRSTQGGSSSSSNARPASFASAGVVTNEVSCTAAAAAAPTAHDGALAASSSTAKKLQMEVRADAVVLVNEQKQKKQRLSLQDTSETFRFKSTDDAPSANPSLFLKYPLREEQRRSLAWMLRRERLSSIASSLRGGLLADCMGYGKTATTIGLICVAGNTNMEPIPEEGYMRLQSTLIVCPAHLLWQWIQEFLKFLGEEVVSVWKPDIVETFQKVLGLGSMRILILEKPSDLWCLKCKHLLDGNFSVVLASARIQRSERYINRMKGESIRILSKPLERYYAESRTKFVIQTHREIIGGSYRDKNDTLPFFESFWWTRVILDEFHESESWDFRGRELLKAVGSKYRWGLSGTPPFDSTESAALVAGLLNYKGGIVVQTYLLQHRPKKWLSADDGDWVDYSLDGGGGGFWSFKIILKKWAPSPFWMALLPHIYRERPDPQNDRFQSNRLNPSTAEVGRSRKRGGNASRVAEVFR
jgi:hypothetical protein